MTDSKKKSDKLSDLEVKPQPKEVKDAPVVPEAPKEPKKDDAKPVEKDEKCDKPEHKDEHKGPDKAFPSKEDGEVVKPGEHAEVDHQEVPLNIEEARTTAQKAEQALVEIKKAEAALDSIGLEGKQLLKLDEKTTLIDRTYPKDASKEEEKELVRTGENTLKARLNAKQDCEDQKKALGLDSEEDKKSEEKDSKKK